MKRTIIFILLAGLATLSFGQKYTAEKGQISFFSDAVVEDIEAVNTAVGSLFNSATGDVVYILKIRDFVFPKALMREHFNEKYMESETYPKATFQGQIIGFSAQASGAQKVRAVGKLSIHGVTRQIDVPGTIENIAGKVQLKSKFMVRLEDYNIRIPTIIFQNIAEEVEVRIDITYKPI